MPKIIFNFIVYINEWVVDSLKLNKLNQFRIRYVEMLMNN